MSAATSHNRSKQYLSLLKSISEAQQSAEKGGRADNAPYFRHTLQLEEVHCAGETTKIYARDDERRYCRRDKGTAQIDIRDAR